MIQRNLDSCFFDIERDNRIKKICFSDLTLMERDKVLENYSNEDLKDICNKLADALEFIGYNYNIKFEEIS